MTDALDEALAATAKLKFVGDDDDDEDDDDENVGDFGDSGAAGASQAFGATQDMTQHDYGASGGAGRKAPGTPTATSNGVERHQNASSECSFDSGNRAATSPPVVDSAALADAHRLPSHACKYCGIHEPSSVAKCLLCKRWFCNGKVGSTGSHVVQHMVRSGHKELCLHKDSVLGEAHLECYHCANKNVFQLGFMRAKADTVVVILCRAPCAQQAATKDSNWADEWKPLVAERQLLNWLLTPPPDDVQKSARKITASQIHKLEDAWKNDPNATLEDVEYGLLCEAEPEHVSLRYSDGTHLARIFHALVAAEADYDRRMKESQTQNVGHVRWDVGLNRKHLAYFNLPLFQEGSMKVVVGDELRLKHRLLNNDEWECVGTVIKVPDNHSDEVGMEMKAGINDKMPTEAWITFTCEAVWNGTNFSRMHSALKSLSEDSKAVSAYIYAKLLGHQVDDVLFKVQLPRVLSAPGLPDLNHSQLQAVRQVLQRPLSMIQGPPGTGKTVTSATIVYHLAQLTGGRVLVCSPSNIAVDQLAERIHLTGLKVVRMYAKTRESLTSAMSFLALHEQLKTLTGAGAAELRKLMMLKDEMGELSAADAARLTKLKRTNEERILHAADVVCTTCASAADIRLNALNFKAVVVDESTQATEPEVLVPIVRGARQLVLIGDHCQLGPVIMSKVAARAGLGQSLFERLILLGNRPFRLQVQYRMHPVLSAFSSNLFYEGSLQNGVTEADRVLRDVAWEWPVPGRPLMFWNCTGVEEMSASGTSYLNRVEAANVEKLVTRLIKGGMRAEQLGIITPYEGQRAYIVQYLQTNGQLAYQLVERIEIANVDAFQGREKDFIIMTTVRSNEQIGIGFLSDPRRLNVALTRAKYGMIVVGNAKVLSRHQLWNDLLQYFKSKQVIVEGPLGGLRKCNVTLSAPRTTTTATTTGAGGAQISAGIPGAAGGGQQKEARDLNNVAYPSMKYGSGINERMSYTLREYNQLPPAPAAYHQQQHLPPPAIPHAPPSAGPGASRAHVPLLFDPNVMVTSANLRAMTGGGRGTAPVPMAMFSTPTVPAYYEAAHGAQQRAKNRSGAKRSAGQWPPPQGAGGAGTSDNLSQLDLHSQQASQTDDLVAAVDLRHDVYGSQMSLASQPTDTMMNACAAASQVYSQMSQQSVAGAGASQLSQMTDDERHNEIERDLERMMLK